MIKKLGLGALGTLMSISTWASLPSSIDYQGTKAVYVNFLEVDYIVQYDIRNEITYATTKIQFEQKEAGHPIYDLVPNAQSITVNGKESKELNVYTPDGVTQYKIPSVSVGPGVHTLEIKSTIDKNVDFSSNGVNSAYWMSDLSDRRYLEQYLPTNLEYDHYKASLLVEFVGRKSNQEIYTNGRITKIHENKYEILFPEYFTASSFFFHTSVKGRFKENRFSYKSITGRDIPITVYSRSSWNVNSGTKRAKKVLAELEGKLGAWAHPSLVIYVAGMGGMEYCGATITSLSALGHELTHSYYARGVMPTTGNSGWIDEAVASWRDDGYKSVSKPNFSSSSMAAHSVFRRTTDRKAYTQGANFMAYLNKISTDQGGLIKFLSGFFKENVHTSVTTKQFKESFEHFSGLNMEADFQKYIYGKEGVEKAATENPYHPKLSEKQLRALL